MRRKSTRNAKKTVTDEEEKTEPPKTRRQSRRRKKSPSSDSDNEPLANLETKVDTTTATTIINPTPSDDDDDNEDGAKEAVWKVTTSADDEDKGDGVHKLKLCLTRPPESPSKTSRRSKSGSHTEDDGEEKIVRRTRSTRNSPFATQQNEEEANEDTKGKGKSKGKHKSKIEKAPIINVEDEVRTNSEIIENVQVTAQSPLNDLTDTKLKNDDDDESENANIQPDASATSDNALNDNVPNKDNQNVPNVNIDVQNEQIDDNEMKTDENPDIIKPEVDENIEEKPITPPAIEKEAEPIVETKETSEKIEKSPERNEEKPEIETNENQERDEPTEQPSPPPSVTKTEENEKIEENITENPPETVNNVEIIEAPEEKPAENKVIPAVPKKKLKRDNHAQNVVEKLSSRRRKLWKNQANTLLNLNASLVKIDLEMIRILHPTVEFPDEDDPHFLDLLTHRRSSTTTSTSSLYRRTSTDTVGSNRVLSERQLSIDKSEEKTAEPSGNEEDTNSNIIAFNRKISIVDDSASKLKPPPSPAKNPVSPVLYITNLVRPFTIKQLRELLERTGKIKDDGFWTDRIKSKCYVHYETQEEAEMTRNALHGVHWPIGNGKKLAIEYATVEDLENAKNPPAPPQIQITPDISNNTQNDLVQKDLMDTGKFAQTDEKIVKNKEYVREWDIGKKDPKDDREIRDKSRKHKRSPSIEDDFITRKQKKAEDTTPQKYMDDLFSKTKAAPCIYWLPLSPEEIAMKQQQRLIRMEEHKRRIEENSRTKGRDVGNRGSSYRRRYD